MTSNLENSERFFLFSTCRPVKGQAFSAIYDLERNILFRFDSAYFPLVDLASKMGVDLEAIERLSDHARFNAKTALTFLKDREMGMMMTAPLAQFRPLSLEWSSPHAILTAVVDVDERVPNWPVLIDQLDGLLCRSIQIRYFSKWTAPSDVLPIFSFIAGSTISRIELIIPYSEDWAAVDWKSVFEGNRGLVLVRMYAAPNTENVGEDQYAWLAGRLLAFTERGFSDASSCGEISFGTLTAPTADLFSELQSYNGCLNRKVSIRSDGQICNCPAIDRTYGDCLETLKETIYSRRFRRLWTINKDSLSVCNKCEFRYVCTDCRAFLGAGSLFNKPAKCQYDPLSGVWLDNSC